MESSNLNTLVLVVGATGFLGTEVCKQLTDAKRKVRGLVRKTSDPNTVRLLQRMGLETVIGDIKEPASLAKAMEGVDAVISTVSSTHSRQEGDDIVSVDLQGQLNVVDAAKNAGVRHFVYVSVIEFDQEIPLQTAKRNVERHLRESSMNYTILRPAMFMDVWLSPALGFDYPHSKAKIYGDGQNKINWISLKDVATFAVSSLENPAARNTIFDLGGPEALSPLEVVKIFEKQNGTAFTLEHIPVDVLETQKRAATDPLQRTFACFMIAYARGCVVDMKSLEQVFPIKLTT